MKHRKFLSVAKRQDGWHVIDGEGYDTSYVSFDTKREALESARILERDPEYIAAFAYAE